MSIIARSAFLLAAVALLSSIATPVRSQTVPQIRVAVTGSDNSAQPYFAQELGYFARAGLAVDIQRMQSAPAIVAAVTSGAVDIGFSVLTTVVVAHKNHIPLIAIAPAGLYKSSEPASALVVATDSAIHTAKDLNGKTIAVPGLGTILEYAPKVWIDRNGGDSATVKFVEIPFPAMAGALDAGRIDATSVTEPYLTLGKRTGRVLTHPSDAIAKEYLIGAWFAAPQWASSHPDIVKRFTAVMRESAIWANHPQNDARSAEILAKYLQMEPALLATMVRTRYGEQLSAALMQPQIDVVTKYLQLDSFPAGELMSATPR